MNTLLVSGKISLVFDDHRPAIALVKQAYHALSDSSGVAYKAQTQTSLE